MVDQETKYLQRYLQEMCYLSQIHMYYMKSIVGFSPANDFNQIIALDPHELGPGLWYLLMIDLFSRLSMAM